MPEGELNPDLCLSQVHPNQVRFPSRELVMAQQGGAQVVGNIGVYYAAYRLSQQGWNVMPPQGNGRGVKGIRYAEHRAQQMVLHCRLLQMRRGYPVRGSAFA
jgi:hypothetical protein